jgi:hypothetical protein
MTDRRFSVQSLGTRLGKLLAIFSLLRGCGTDLRLLKLSFQAFHPRRCDCGKAAMKALIEAFVVGFTTILVFTSSIHNASLRSEHV